MSGNKAPVPEIIIAALISIIMLMRVCSPPKPPEAPQVVTEVDTMWVYKEIPVEVKVPVPYGVPVDRPVPVNVDTAAILKDYFAVRYYKDSVAIDTIGHVIVEDSVSQNTITYRKTYGDYTIPVIKETTTITLPPERKTQVYGGFMIGAPVLVAGPQFTLKTKNDNLYQVGAGITPAGPFISFGMGWKIKLKK